MVDFVKRFNGESEVQSEASSEVPSVKVFFIKWC